MGLGWWEELDFNSHNPLPGEMDDDASLGNRGNGKAIMNTGKEKGRGCTVPPIRQASGPRK